MKTLSLTIVAFCCFTLAMSQDFKYGKVSKAEIEEKVHPMDASASAAVLYINEMTSFL